MKFLIDRFEEDFAVLENEDKKLVTVKRDLIPENSSEGSVLLFNGTSYEADIERTKNERIENYKNFLELKPKKISE